MLVKGPAKKVTIYLNEDTQYHLGPLYEAILTFLMHRGVAGATASRGLAGFGAHRVLHTPKVEALSEHLPIRIEFVESAQRVDELLPTLYDMVADGLIEVQDTTVVKMATKEKKTEPKHPHEAKRGQAKLMRIYMGEADKWQGGPLYDAILKQLRMMDISGATVYRGIAGYGAKGHSHKESFWHHAHDLPIMISVVDVAEKIEEASNAIEVMIEGGLIVLSDVEVVHMVHSHTLEDVSDASRQTS